MEISSITCSCGKQFSNAFDVCPKCGEPVEPIEEQQNQLDNEQTSEQELMNFDENQQTSFSSSMDSDLLEMKNYSSEKFIVCQICGRNNLRNAVACSKCFSNLSDQVISKEEEYYRYLTQQLSEGEIDGYFEIGLRLLLLSFLRSKNPDLNFFESIRCGTKNKTQCPYLLNVMDDFCPTCNVPHVQIFCIHEGCNAQMKIGLENCIQCGNETSYYMFKEALNGTIKGEIVDEIHKFISSKLNHRLTKTTKSAQIGMSEKTEIKEKLQQYSSYVASISKIVGNYLMIMTTTEKTETIEFKPANVAIEENWGNAGDQGLDYEDPNVSPELLAIVSEVQSEMNENQTEVTESIEDEEDDEEDEDEAIAGFFGGGP